MHKIVPCVLFTMACFAAVAVPAPSQVLKREIPLDGATTLRLNVSGSVHVTPVDGQRGVMFDVVDSGPSTPPIDVRVTHAGKRLDVSITGPSQSLLPFTGASGYELQVTYPASLKLDLREFAGRVHVDRVSAPMQIYDADGNIVVDRAPAALTAQADSGDITVAGAHARITLSVINGNVDATLAPGWSGRLVRLEAQSGNLLLRVPVDFSAHYDLTTGAGHVRNPLRNNLKGPLVFMLAEQGNVSIQTQ
jgi:hypothetical protein